MEDKIVNLYVAKSNSNDKPKVVYILNSRKKKLQSTRNVFSNINRNRHENYLRKNSNRHGNC